MKSCASRDILTCAYRRPALCKVCWSISASNRVRCRQKSALAIGVQAEIFKSIGGREQASDASSDLRKDWARKGAWATAIGPGVERAGVPVRTDGWNGHLVLRVEELLVDGAIEMLNNSPKELILPKLLWTSVDPEWDAGTQYACLTLPNGCEVVYGKLSDGSWRDAPYWKAETEPYKSMQSRMVEAILTQVNP
jgi:hypothetical protein